MADVDYWGWSVDVDYGGWRNILAYSISGVIVKQDGIML
jgi:hypothetical protein